MISGFVLMERWSRCTFPLPSPKYGQEHWTLCAKQMWNWKVLRREWTDWGYWEPRHGRGLSSLGLLFAFQTGPGEASNPTPPKGLDQKAQEKPAFWLEVEESDSPPDRTLSEDTEAPTSSLLSKAGWGL